MTALNSILGWTIMYKILFADDEKKIREVISEYLSAKGFLVDTAANGIEAVEKAAESSYDLLMLDIMMPEMDGITACKEIREFSETPILFFSALGDEVDMLKGFEAGADDYITKPFPLSVLAQKCRMLIRRSKGNSLQDDSLEVSGIRLDYRSHHVSVNNMDTNITGKDFALLAYLMENKNIVLDRELIIAKVWSYAFDGESRVVDTHIKNIRKALGEKGSLIETVIGTGYVFKDSSNY